MCHLFCSVWVFVHNHPFLLLQYAKTFFQICCMHVVLRIRQGQRSRSEVKDSIYSCWAELSLSVSFHYTISILYLVIIFCFCVEIFWYILGNHQYMYVAPLIYIINHTNYFELNTLIRGAYESQWLLIIYTHSPLH